MKAHHGDWAGATESYLDDFQLGEEILHGGNFNALTTEHFCQAEGLSDPRVAIPHLTGAQARAAVARLERINARMPAYADVFQEEKNAGLGLMKEAFRQPGWRHEVFRVFPGDYFDTVSYDVYSKQDALRHFTRTMDRAISVMHQPYAANRGAICINSNPLTYRIYGLSSINDRHNSCARDDAYRALLLACYARRDIMPTMAAIPPR